MPGTFLPTVLRHLRQLLGRSEAEGVSDGQLLEHFIVRREESAFAALMQRHGAMVLGVCRRHLEAHDAEDVFQATFLVLIKKAPSIRKQQSVASWLHGVAYRLAAKARGQTFARRRHEKEAGDMRTNEAPAPELAWRELQHILDEELQRLPERYRLPLVHCYLEEQTHEEAAAALGWRVGTVKSRLARGKDQLRRGLTKRGLALSVPALTATLAVNGSASAGVPATLAQATTHAATLAGAGQALIGVVSTKVLALMEGAVSAMAASKMKLAVFVCMILGLLTGGGTLAVHGWGDDSDNRFEDANPAERKAEKKPDTKLEGNAEPGRREQPKKADEEAWIPLVKSGLLTVEVEPCLYEVKGEKRFLMALRLTNLSNAEIGIDWHERKRSLYPNQWGVHDSKTREIVDERRTIHKAPDQDQVKADFNAGKQTRIAARKSTVVFTEFNNSGRAQVDAAKGKYLIISMDGLFCATDGKAVDVITCTWDKAHRPQETDVVMPFPVTWKAANLPPPKALLGDWYLVAWEGEGARKWDAPIKFTWATDKVSWTIDGKKQEREIKLLPNQPEEQPQPIDLTDAQGKTLRGIYAIKGDTLWLCESVGEEIARPTEFTVTPFTTLKFFRREATPSERFSGLRATIDASPVSIFDQQLFLRLFLVNESDKPIRVATYCGRKDETLADGSLVIRRTPVLDDPKNEVVQRIVDLNVITLQPGQKHQVETTLQYEQFTLRESLTVSFVYSVSDAKFITKHGVWSGEVRTRPLVVPIKAPALAKDAVQLPTKWVERHQYTWPDVTFGMPRFSRDGRFLAAAGKTAAKDDCGVRVWNTKTGAAVFTAFANDRKTFFTIGRVAISPTGRYVAALGGGGFVNNHLLVWDVENGKEVLRKQVGFSDALVFGPDDKTLLIGERKEAVLLNVETDKAVALGAAEHHSQYSFSDDGKALVAWNNVRSKWDFFEPRTGQPLPEPDFAKQINKLSGDLLRQFAPPWGARVGAPEKIGARHFFNIYDVATAKKLLRFPIGDKEELVFSPDGTLLAGVDFRYIDNDSRKPHTTLVLRSAATGRELATLELPVQRFVGFATEKHCFFTASQINGVIRLWGPAVEKAKTPDAFYELPIGIGVRSWHIFTQADEIRISWYSKPPDVAHTCWVDLNSQNASIDVLEEGKKTEQGVRISTARRHKLSDAQKKALQLLIQTLPPSQKGLDLKGLVLVSVRIKGEVKNYVYDRSALPPEIRRLVDLTGADLNSAPATEKKD